MITKQTSIEICNVYSQIESLARSQALDDLYIGDGSSRSNASSPYAKATAEIEKLLRNDPNVPDEIKNDSSDIPDVPPSTPETDPEDQPTEPSAPSEPEDQTQPIDPFESQQAQAEPTPVESQPSTEEQPEPQQADEEINVWTLEPEEIKKNTTEQIIRSYLASLVPISEKFETSTDDSIDPTKFIAKSEDKVEQIAAELFKILRNYKDEKDKDGKEIEYSDRKIKYLASIATWKIYAITLIEYDLPPKSISLSKEASLKIYEFMERTITSLINKNTIDKFNEDDFRSEVYITLLENFIKSMLRDSHVPLSTASASDEAQADSDNFEVVFPTDDHDEDASHTEPPILTNDNLTEEEHAKINEDLDELEGLHEPGEQAEATEPTPASQPSLDRHGRIDVTTLKQGEIDDETKEKVVQEYDEGWEPLRSKFRED